MGWSNATALPPWIHPRFDPTTGHFSLTVLWGGPPLKPAGFGKTKGPGTSPRAFHMQGFGAYFAAITITSTL